MDFVEPPRLVRMQFLSGRGHYDVVMRAVMEARRSIWISTANLKELMVEDHRAVPGRPRITVLGTPGRVPNLPRGARASGAHPRPRDRSRYRSILDFFDEMAGRGVELRILHAAAPSRAFRGELDRHPRLLAGGLELRVCPRVHFKAVVVDGAFLYLGSANWTGAGLGAKGSGRRNFELGLVTRDDGLLDQVQRMFDQIWRGAACGGCKVRDLCPAPLDGVVRHPIARRVRAVRAGR